MNSKRTILLADNDEEFLKVRKEFLEMEGYRVLSANNPVEARKLLEGSHIDLAIIDVRLEDDMDERDLSGLRIAEEVAPSVPKIIMTAYPTVETIRKALTFGKRGLPAAVDFVQKQDSREHFLASIRRSVAVHSENKPKRVILDLSVQLEKDYDESRKQAIFTNRIRLVLAIAGSLVIIGGSGMVLLGQTTAGGLSVLSGVVVEALAGLFSKISEDANKRMDRYHEELLKLYIDQK